jgi:hypothetical protein
MRVQNASTLESMAKQKLKKGGPSKDLTDAGGSGGPPGKKQRRKVRRNNKAK